MGATEMKSARAALQAIRTDLLASALTVCGHRGLVRAELNSSPGRVIGVGDGPPTGSELKTGRPDQSAPVARLLLRARS